MTDDEENGAICLPSSPTQRRFFSGRMPLQYTDWGNEDAPLLILIHGSRDHARSWDWTAGALQRDWHIVAPDLRGHGNSAWSSDGRYDFAAFLSDLAALFDTLGDRRATIVAHSLGAHIALRFAAIFPDKVERLVAVEAVGSPIEEEAAWNNGAVDDHLREWLTDRARVAASARRMLSSTEEAAERLRIRNPDLGAARTYHLARHGLERGDGGWHWKHDPYMAIRPFPDMSDDEAFALMRRVDCPTLLLYGDKSWRSSVPERLIEAMGHAQVMRFAQGGHWLHHDCFDAFLAAVRAFIHDGGCADVRKTAS